MLATSMAALGHLTGSERSSLRLVGRVVPWRADSRPGGFRGLYPSPLASMHLRKFPPRLFVSPSFLADHLVEA